MTPINRNKTVQARLSEEELERVTKQSDELGLSISSYVRLVVLNAKIQVNVKIGDVDKLVK